MSNSPLPAARSEGLASGTPNSCRNVEENKRVPCCRFVHVQVTVICKVGIQQSKITRLFEIKGSAACFFDTIYL